MKKYMILLAAFAIAACATEEMPEKVRQDKQALTFIADAVATKTTLNDDWTVSWNEGDEVSILWRGGQATSKARLEGDRAYFSAVVEEVSEYYAVYPSTVVASVGVDGKLSLQLPSQQAGTFEGCAVIIAHTTREKLDFGQFKSAVAMVRFTLDDTSITRARFASPDGSAVGGSIIADASLEVTAEASGTAIDVDLDGSGTYYLSLLPGLSLPGLSFQLGNESAWKGEAVSSSPASIAAGQVLCVNSSVDSHMEVMGDFYFTVDGAGTKDASSAKNAGDIAQLKILLSDPASGAALDGHTIHLGAGTYDMAVGESGLAPDYETPASVVLEGVPGETVLTTSLSGEQGCILTVASDNANFTLKGITFTGASHNGFGGALNITKGSHRIENCVFTNNQVTSSTADRTGGAAYIGGTASADFEGCTFTGNKAAITGGGALAVFSTSRVTVLDCCFSGNITHTGSAYVGNGGAILQKKAGNILYVVNSRFSDNGTATNGSDIFSSAGAALLLCNNTFAHPRYPDAKSWNRGNVRANVPVFAVNCTFVVNVDTEATGAGCNNGVLAFSQSNNNAILGNLMLSNAGYSMGAGATYTSTTTKTATTYGHNVYSVAPKIKFTDSGGDSDLTGIRTADVVADSALSEDGLLHWDGPSVKLPSYKTATATEMATAIRSYPVGGETFYNWLVEKDVFGKDAAGNSRGEDGWWPGAYQKP